MNPWIKLKDGVERCIESAIERLVDRKFSKKIEDSGLRFDIPMFVQESVSRIISSKTSSNSFLAEVDKEIKGVKGNIVLAIHADLQERIDKRVEELIAKAEMVGLSIPSKEQVIITTKELRSENLRLRKAQESIAEAFSRMDSQAHVLQYRVDSLTLEVAVLKKKRSKK